MKIVDGELYVKSPNIFAGYWRREAATRVAFIVLRSPVDPSELDRRCRDNLASFKVPRAFTVVERLPRNALGKVQKHLLPLDE